MDSIAIPYDAILHKHKLIIRTTEQAYVKPYVEEEIQGLADATGLPVTKIRRVMWIPELTRGSCSMFGAWGNATKSRDGKLLQLR